MDRSLYHNALYPLQDTVLSLVVELDLPFYLTGGTALSRHYLNHRYSDDLDLFVNSHPDFRGLVDAIEAGFKDKQLTYQAITRSADFVRLQVSGTDDTILKVDLVNDLVCHIGEFERSPQLGLVDNVFNILSNKISALPRLAIKDFADIVFIARKYTFNWKVLIGEAFQKDEWVNPLDLARYFTAVPPNRFELIQWVEPVNVSEIILSCQKIADEIILGADNSLARK